MNETTGGGIGEGVGVAKLPAVSIVDVRGVEVGGAARTSWRSLGDRDCRGLGASASAALTTRGFASWFASGGRWAPRLRRLDGPLRPVAI